MSTYAEQAERYVILIEGGPPSNYSAWSPDLPGCAATGATVDECEAEMKDAIAFHLEGLAEDGGPIPDGSGPGVYVERTPRTAAWHLCGPSATKTTGRRRATSGSVSSGTSSAYRARRALDRK